MTDDYVSPDPSRQPARPPIALPEVAPIARRKLSHEVLDRLLVVDVIRIGHRREVYR